MTMYPIIPQAVMAVCSAIVAGRETHSTLDALFIYAGAPRTPPLGPDEYTRSPNKYNRALEWLRVVNKDDSVKPLEVLGQIIENYMEIPLDPEDQEALRDRERMNNALEESGLQYIKGGKIISSLSATPSHTLEEFIKNKDLQSINLEYERALHTADSSPREAVSAASNILESVCKFYIEDEKLNMPAKQDLQSIWTVVRNDLGFTPKLMEDNDLKKILSGLISVVDGVGALRTHASSAHGSGQKSYKLETRHAQLAIHAAHTVVLFILQTWDKRYTTKSSAINGNDASQCTTE